MARLVIYGASDDLVEVEGVFREEFEALPKWEGFVVSPDGDKLYVWAEFSSSLVPGGAEWTIGVANAYNWPDWQMHYEDRPDYEGDPALVLDVPEGTTVVSLHDEED